MKIKFLSIYCIFNLFANVLLQATNIGWGGILQQSDHIETAIPYDPDQEPAASFGYGIDGLHELYQQKREQFLAQSEGFNSFQITYKSYDDYLIEGLAFLPDKSADSDPIKLMVYQRSGIGLWGHPCVLDAAALINFVKLGYAVFVSGLIRKDCTDEVGGQDVDDALSFLELAQSLSPHINGNDYTLLGFSRGCLTTPLMIERLRCMGKQLPHKVVFFSPLANYGEIIRKYRAKEMSEDFGLTAGMEAQIARTGKGDMEEMIRYRTIYKRASYILHGIDLIVLHATLDQVLPIIDHFVPLKEHFMSSGAAISARRIFIQINAPKRDDDPLGHGGAFNSLEAFDLVKLFLEDQPVHKSQKGPQDFLVIDVER